MGMEKGLVSFDNKPLIRYSIDVLKGICDEILISSNSDAYHHMGYRVIPDEITGIGPVGGIYSCLRASATTDNIILSCDTPFISKAYLQYLLKNRKGATAAVPWFGNNKYEPVSAYYNKAFIEVLADSIQEGNYKLPDIFEKTKINRLSITNLDFFEEKLFYNINSPEDIDNISKP